MIFNIKKIFYISTCLVTVTICNIYCKEATTSNVNSNTKYSESGRFIVKEIYDSAGHLKIKQYLNRDTVPEGPMIEYNTNDVIIAWIWFVKGEKNPKCGVFYKEDGYFDTLKGQTFLGVGRDNHENPVIMAINPPQVKLMIAYKDFYKNKIFKEIYYTDPYRTDSMTLISLDEYKYRNEHKYKIYFSIVDSIKKTTLYTDSMEFIPTGPRLNKK
jgi:hypothetical protein